MSNFRIEYTHPWLLLLLIPAVAFTLFPYFRAQKKYRRTRNKIVSLVTHLTALVLGINLLAGLSFSYEKPNLENELVILVDGTDSGEGREDDKRDFVQSIINISDGGYRVGVVKFGFDTTDTGELTLDSDAVLEDYLSMDSPDGTATDLASALKHARGLLKNPEGAKIVIVSDGIETDNAALAVIKSIAAEGVRVDTALFPNEESGEVAVYSVTTPTDRITLGEIFVASMDIRSNLEGEHAAVVRVYDNGTLLGEKVELLNGATQKIDVPLSLAERGMHELHFEIEVEGDTVSENNGYRTYINLAAFDNILLIEHAEGEGATLASLLSERFNVTDMSISDDLPEIPRTLNELANYEQVVLVNVAYSDMPAGFEEMLNEYVYELGGGLFTVGGANDVVDGVEVPHSYNRNDMAQSTYYKQMLPVNAVDYTPPIAVMIVIDTSASMSGQRLPQAKLGAEAVLDGLSDRDFCGVMSFNTGASEELQVLPVSQRDTIIETIRRVGNGEQDSASGGTIFSGAISLAGRALSVVSNVERKHIILVTDGNPGDSYEQYLPYIEDNMADGITMSVVVVDADSAVVDKMTQTANAGGGKYYGVAESEIQTLPDIMQQDIALEVIAEIEQGTPFDLKIKDRTAAVAGIEEELIPQLTGYYGTVAKNGAKVPLMGKYVPLYAEWKYGAGSVGSFMCDLSGIWSAEFIGDTVGQAIVFNIVNSLFPAEDVRADGIDYVIKTENYYNQLNVHGVPEDGRAEVSVTPVSEHLADVIEGVTVTSLESNRRFNFVIKNAGLYEIVIKFFDGAGAEISEAVTYRVFSYSEEYNSFTEREPLGEELMTLLAQDGKGAAVEDPAEVFMSFSKTIKKEYDPRVLFLILVIVLVLIDIAVRKFKFKWPHELVREYRQKKADAAQSTERSGR